MSQQVGPEFANLMATILEEYNDPKRQNLALSHFNVFESPDQVTQLEAFTQMKYSEQDTGHLPLYYERAKKEAMKEFVKKFIIEHQTEYGWRIDRVRGKR